LENAESSGAEYATLLEEQEDAETDCRVLLDRIVRLRAHLEDQILQWNREYQGAPIHGPTPRGGGPEIIEVSDDEGSGAKERDWRDEAATTARAESHPAGPAETKTRSPSSEGVEDEGLESKIHMDDEEAGESSESGTVINMSSITVTHPKPSKGDGPESA